MDGPPATGFGHGMVNTQPGASLSEDAPEQLAQRGSGSSEASVGSQSKTQTKLTLIFKNIYKGAHIRL
ncbi:MAG: hypothetical protein CMB97_00610 [Flavobacteriaceae bacterium]|nr:hypothetical protein [Flavobacteriaceae bacterium]